MCWLLHFPPPYLWKLVGWLHLWSWSDDLPPPHPPGSPILHLGPHYQPSGTLSPPDPLPDPPAELPLSSAPVWSRLPFTAPGVVVAPTVTLGTGIEVVVRVV